MKPYRGKRIGPRSRPSEFSASCVGRARLRIFGPWRAFARVGACTFRRAVSHDRFVGGQKSARMVAACFGRQWYSLARRWPALGPRRYPAVPAFRRGLARSPGSFDWCVLLAVHADCGASSVGFASVWHSGSMANRSATYPTRLETRTKESNMCASHGALRNLKA